MTDFANLILGVDTRGLREGERALDDLSGAAGDAANDVDTMAYRMGEATGKLAKFGFGLLKDAVVGAATSFALMAWRSNELVGNIVQTANRLNMSVESFQKVAYAARSVGVENEKLGDIFKDVNDKVGEFLQTGGGELSDFFENIAPRVGVTAEAFRGLNGADALQLYVSSLEKAGVNSQEMTFYLEALADEASALIPIMTNGGDKLTSMGNEAQRLGLILDEKTTQAALRFNAQTMQLTNVIDILSVKAMAILLPQLIQMQEFLIKNQGAILNLVEGFGKLINVILGAANAYKRFKLEQGLALAKNTESGWLTSEEDKAKARADILRYQQALNEMDRPQRGSREGAFGTGGINALVQQSDLARQKVAGLGMAATTAGAALGKGLGGGAKAANDNIKPMRDQMQSAMDTLAQFKREMASGGVFSSAANQLKTFARPEGELSELRNRAAGVNAFDSSQKGLYPSYIKQDMDALNAGLTTLYEKTEEARNRTETGTKAIAESFRTMATDALAALDRLAAGIESGNFLSILSGVVDIGLQLGGMGVFGKETQANILSSRGRANGGSVSAGRAYVVGENRPEVFIPDTNGRIQPSVGSGGGQVIVINNSALADVYVDGRVQAAAPAIVSASANYTQSTMARRSTRRVA